MQTIFSTEEAIKAQQVESRNEKRVPNFLIAGSGESGTSWLSACLLHHPEIFLPKEMRPEPHFFYKSQEYAKGFEYYLDRYFSEVPKQALAIGERSSSYMFSDIAIERMAMALPDAKIILMLREPIQRAYSNWRFTTQSGLETESFERAIALEEQRISNEKNPFWREIQPFAYKGRSLYGKQVERIRMFYPESQVLILNSDQVKKDEPGALRRVCHFLGVDDSFSFPNPGTFPTSSVKNRQLQAWLRKVYGSQFDAAIENTRLAKPDPATQKPLVDWLLKMNLTDKHPKLQENTRKTLQEFFKDSNRQLAEYVDWDTSAW